MTKVQFNDLPKLSSWPARMLGAEIFLQKERSASEVEREYGKEKWGNVLGWLKEAREITKEDLLAQQGVNPDTELLYMEGEEIFKARAADIMEKYSSLLIETIRPYSSRTLVELGAGLGDKLLSVVAGLGNVVEAFGGEFTASGVECGQILAGKSGANVKFFRFDYNDPATLAKIPEGSVIYTSHSIEQIPQLQDSFIEGLIKARPRHVIHLEPCYEDQDQSTMIGLLRRKYTEMNDYNRNLVGLLMKYEASGKISIVRHEKNVFSDTPFNPTSILVWKPS
jgi:hypothetical protein